MTAKYDRIGKGYNKYRVADPGLVERFIYFLELKEENQYLDIGCGTGNYTIAVSSAGGHFIGVDPSSKMLSVAGKNNSTIQWKKGTAENIPAENASMDGVIASLTIHHWTDLAQGFKEVYRILKPGGSLVLFTSTPSQMEGYWLNHYFPKMLQKSIRQMPRLNAINSALHEADFTQPEIEKYFVAPNLKDHFLYVGKHNPSLYTIPEVRQGISSFSALAHQDEVEHGIQLLKEDISSNKIKEIIALYTNELGDYLFLKTRKPG